ncbi:MAG: cytochrome c-type biogenesis protein CcmH [Rhodospirillales bacterium]|nr:cytochrome c-type biogenesis protein CcmH [Rhodospirillales bacterium]
MKLRLLLILWTWLAAAPALAVDPREVLADPALEARARALSQELRCLVCQNQSIDDSDADLARDLRKLVRERIAAGDDDRRVIDYVVSRYGDFVLLRPRLTPATYLLWFGPLAIVLLGLLALAVFYRRNRADDPAVPAPLSPDERRRLESLLKDGPR